MSIDLSTLPPPDVIEALTFEALLAEIKAEFQERHPGYGDLLDLESEPVVKLLEVFAYRELLLRARYNDEARALLLAFSTGATLDHIGATYYQEARLVVEAENPATVPPTPAVMESDLDYRIRLSQKPESWSSAGPRQAYRWHAISTDGQIKDASVTSPAGGTTQIYILTHSASGLPGEPLLAAVRARVNGDTVRPLSEEVIVSAPAIINYTLSVTLTLQSGPASELILQAARAALQSYATRQHHLGGEIIRSAITAAAHVAGVKKVVINTPAADLVCSPGQAPWCTAITVTLGGIE